MSTMQHYPIHVDLAGKRCVVVGAGNVAERRVKALRACGAEIRLVAPEATPQLRGLDANGEIIWMKFHYHEGHLEDAFLVVAATSVREVNAIVTRDAQERNLLVCCADRPNEGNFIIPAQVSRGDLLMTVSTSGQSPTLTSVLRERLEEEYNEEWATVVAFIGTLRPLIRKMPSEVNRKKAIRILLDEPEIRGLVRNGDFVNAEVRAIECLSLLLE